MIEKRYGLLAIALLVLFAGAAFGQYKMERNVFAPGVPGKADAGSNYIMSEGAMTQTAADTVWEATAYTVQQGYIHRPFRLEIAYEMGDIGHLAVFDAGLTPQTGWYEPTGKLNIHADTPVIVADSLYYFDHWTSTTGAAFDDANASDTWFPFYKSHSISAVYKTQYRVTFAANTKNDEDYTAWNPTTYPQMKLLDATDFVKVTYSNQGVATDATPIYDGTSVTVWADYNEDWTYSDYNTDYVPADAVRWLTIDADHTGPISETQAGQTITCDYYQQFKCAIDVVYSPDTWTPPDVPGTVDGVAWKECFVDGTPTDGYTNTDDWLTTPRWVDAASELGFPEMTSGGWYTVNLRHWDPLDKPLTKTIIYSQTIEAVMAATMFMWRGYSLMGIPLYPTEDTTAYRVHAASAYTVPASWPPAVGRTDGRGDQEVVVYDDLDSSCALCDASSIVDSVCGVYGDWWSVSKYYPDMGAYRRYRGPGVPIDGSVEPFWPGRGFWFIQDHCDELPIDVHGTLVDTTVPYEIRLGVYNGSDYSMYNMIANPFFNLGVGDIDVRWDEAQIYLGSDPSTVKSVVDAATAGWIEATAQVYRGGGYVPLNAATEDPCELHEAEGLWLKTGTSSLGDTVVVMMRPHSIVGGRRERPAPEEAIASIWKIQFGAECDEVGQADMANIAGYKEYRELPANPILTTFEMPEFTYPAPHLRVFFRDFDGKELSDQYLDERASVMTWNAVLDCRAVKGRKVDVKWSLSDIPAGMELHLKDAAHDEYIDMLAQSEYSFADDGGIYNVEIIA
ncbi:hypothetical protein J7L01_00650, partial [bacterium]|nr:hypothetical protein [bacterium]